MKDYYATIKIQNGRLKSAMQSEGIKTASELSKVSGVSFSQVLNLLNFKSSPRLKKQVGWKETTKKICEALNQIPEDIFPDHLEKEIVTNKISLFVNEAQLRGQYQSQIQPNEEIEEIEMVKAVEDVLETLRPRERKIIEDRFWGDKTCEEISKDFNISRSRVHQMEQKALRKLRYISRSKKLRDVCSF